MPCPRQRSGISLNDIAVAMLFSIVGQWQRDSCPATAVRNVLRWLAHGAKRPGRIRIGGSGARVYGRTHTASNLRSAHGHRSRVHRVFRAKPPPSERRPRVVTALRALPPREDAASVEALSDGPTVVDAAYSGGWPVAAGGSAAPFAAASRSIGRPTRAPDSASVGDQGALAATGST